MPRLYAHIVNYGPVATGKSYFAASAASAGPMIVFLSDSYGKDTPYLERMVEPPTRTQENGIWIAEGHVQEGHRLRIEYLHEDEIEVDDKPRKHLAAQKDYYTEKLTGFKVAPYIRTRLSRLLKDERDQWETVVFDSGTSLELCLRQYEQYVMNPDAANGMQWFGGSADALERLLITRMASWPKYLIVITHTANEKEGDEAGTGPTRYKMRFPGRLPGEFETYYTEVYHAFTKEVNGKTEYLLQTRSDAQYKANSAVFHAPNPSPNNFAAVTPQEAKP